MRVIESGHIYELDYIDIDKFQGGIEDNPKYDGSGRKIVFVNREDSLHPGTQTQEVLRVLIDRTMHCDNCLPHSIDDAIIYHLRIALEARALVRKVEKGLIEPENIQVADDGHFALSRNRVETSDSSDWVGRRDDRYKKFLERRAEGDSVPQARD